MPASAASSSSAGHASWGTLSGTELKRRFQTKVDREAQVMFCEMESQSLMRRLVETMIAFCVQVKLEFNEQCISITCMDSSQTAMLDFVINKTNFKTFDVKRPITIGVDLGTFKDVLTSGTQDDFLRMWSDESEYFHVALFNRKYDCLTQEFKWKKVNIEDEDLFAPHDKCEGMPNITMQSWQFRDRMNDYKQISETVDLFVNDRHLTFSCRDSSLRTEVWTDLRVDSTHDGEDSDVESRLKIHTVDPDDGHEDMSFKKTYSLKILEMVAKAGTLSKDVKVWLYRQHPACFHFDLNGSSDNGY